MGEVNTNKTPTEETQAVATDQQMINDESQSFIEALKQTIETQQKTIAENEATISEHEATIAQLQAENSQVTTATKTLPEHIVEHSGKSYRFRFRAFFYKAKRYEARDAALDEKLITDILSDKNQMILKEVF